MKTLRACSFVFGLSAMIACTKKKYSEPINTNDSFFYSKMLVDGQPVEMYSGKNDYYMYSYCKRDSNNVYNLVGEFKKLGCTSCNRRLRIQINDYKVSETNSVIEVDSALKVKKYLFLGGANNFGYSVNFSGSFNKPYSSILWDFGDGYTSNELNPKHVFKNGKYGVSLTMKSSDNCQSKITDSLYLWSGNGFMAYISATSSSKQLVFAPHIFSGISPYTYNWDFGDGSGSTDANPSHTYSLSGNYAVKLTVTDRSNATTICTYNAATADGNSNCAANFAFGDIVYVSRRLGLSKVNIQYTDEKGRLFTSDDYLQPSGSSLEILAVEDFVNNENDKPVKKVKMKFNCTLYRYGGLESVSLQGVEVVVGLAYI